MRKTQRMLVILLCILMAVSGFVPITALEAQAAEPITLYPVSGAKYVIGEGSYNIEVEAGQKVHLENLVYFYKEDGKGRDSYAYWVFLSEVSGEKYKSSNTAVAKVSPGGEMTLKKAGKAKIKITYKKGSLTLTVRVVKKGKLGSANKKYKKIQQAAEKVNSYKDKNITIKNCYKISQAISDLQKVLRKSKVVSIYGFQTSQNSSDYYSYGSGDTKLIMPELLDAAMVRYRLSRYSDKRNPVGVYNHKAWFKVKSVSAKKGKKSFTINIKKKASPIQIFAIKHAEVKDIISENIYVKKDGVATFSIRFKDTETGTFYVGEAKIKENSSKINVTLKDHKLIAGHKYELNMDSSWTGWADGKTFKAK